jgi:hypothetical protein
MSMTGTATSRAESKRVMNWLCWLSRLARKAASTMINRGLLNSEGCRSTIPRSKERWALNVICPITVTATRRRTMRM